MSDESTPQLAEQLGRAFYDELTSELEAGHLRHIAEENARTAAAGDHDTCATHLYLDANETMAAAFRITFGREIDLQDDADLTLVPAGWQVGKRLIAENFLHPED